MDKNIGKKFNKLKVVSLDHIDNNYIKYYLFKCECGKEKVINFQSVKAGKTKSCGCNYKEILGKLRKKENKYYKKKDYIIGYATNTNNKFYIDNDDYEKIKDISWYEASNGYMSHKERNKKVILMHRYILNVKNDMLVDHINHNKRDNRKKNLRLVTHRENNLNRKKKPKGISKHKVGNNYYYMVQLDGYRGNFKTYKEAKNVRDEIIKKEYNI